MEIRPEHAGQHPAAAPERVQHELARIEAALDRDLVNKIRDLRAGHAISAERRLLGRHAQGCRNRGVEDPLGGVAVEFHAAAEKDVGVHVADQHENVGHRRLAAAEPVTRGAGA